MSSCFIFRCRFVRSIPSSFAVSVTFLSLAMRARIIYARSKSSRADFKREMSPVTICSCPAGPQVFPDVLFVMISFCT